MEYYETMKIDAIEVCLLLWKYVHYVLNQVYSKYNISVLFYFEWIC